MKTCPLQSRGRRATQCAHCSVPASVIDFPTTQQQRANGVSWRRVLGDALGLLYPQEHRQCYRAPESHNVEVYEIKFSPNTGSQCLSQPRKMVGRVDHSGLLGPPEWSLLGDQTLFVLSRPWAMVGPFISRQKCWWSIPSRGQLPLSFTWSMGSSPSAGAIHTVLGGGVSGVCPRKVREGEPLD